MIVWLLAAWAFAQEDVDFPDAPDINAQLFRPSIDAGATLWTNDASRAPSRYFSARTALAYSRDLVVAYAQDGQRASLFSSAVQTDWLVGYTLGPVRAGAYVPIYLVTLYNQDRIGAGLGDAVIEAKTTALDPRLKPAGMAVLARVVLPTATFGAPVGAGSVGVEGELVLDERPGPVRLAQNVGFRAVPGGTTIALERADGQVADIHWENKLYLRLAGGYAVSDDAGGSAELSTFVTPDAAFHPAFTPVELLAGGWYRAANRWVLRAGLGTGLSPGLGAATLRGVFAVSYEPPDVDPDLDGVMNRFDECPKVGEDRDGFEDGDGCPDFDNDGDGLADADDRCPDQAEDRDGYQDEDGCEDPFTARIKLVNEAGIPIAGAKVAIDSHPPILEDEPEFGVHLPPGTYAVDAVAEGFIDLSTTFTLVGRTDEEVIRVMKPALHDGTLQLLVVDEEGAPLDASFVVGDGAVARTENGLATAILPYGEHLLVVRAEGRATQKVKVKVEAGRTASVQVPLPPSRVQVGTEQLTIYGKVFFESGSRNIRDDSFQLLDEIAQTLVDHAEVLRVRIEGHTDAIGNEGANVALSRIRAEEVLSYLAAQGVEKERMYALGLGSQRPLVEGDDEDAHALNRRVEFWIEKRAP